MITFQPVQAAEILYTATPDGALALDPALVRWKDCITCGRELLYAPEHGALGYQLVERADARFRPRFLRFRLHGCKSQ